MTGRLRVLIVEDNKQIRLIYNIGLHDSVFEKQFVENGREAVEIYEEWRPDIIILDIMLPVMSGYSVLKVIREDKRDQTTTVIMASSLSDREAVLDCLKLGIQGYLVKPFTHKDVARKTLEYYRKVDPERAETAIAKLDASNGRGPVE